MPNVLITNYRIEVRFGIAVSGRLEFKLTVILYYG
jgi:hypothetical protein